MHAIFIGVYVYVCARGADLASAGEGVEDNVVGLQLQKDAVHVRDAGVAEHAVELCGDDTVQRAGRQAVCARKKCIEIQVMHGFNLVLHDHSHARTERKRERERDRQTKHRANTEQERTKT